MSKKISENRRPKVHLKCERESHFKVKMDDIPGEAETEISEPLPLEEPIVLSPPGCRLKLRFCVGNRAYGHAWLRGLAISHPDQFATIGAILQAVLFAEGGDITQEEVVENNQQAAEYVNNKGFKVVPKDGCIMRDNGEGIRHAKYSPSKNIAILWLRVEETIFYAFDDHGGVTFHRGIYALQSAKHGRKVLPIKERTPQRVVKELARAQLTPALRKAYEKKFQLNGTIVSFRKLKEPRRKSRLTERQLRESKS